VPAFAAAGLAFLNLIAVFIWLPESLTEAKRADLTHRAHAILDLQALQESLRRPRVGPLLYTRFFFGLAFATLETIFPLYAEYRLDLNEQSTSYILAYVGVLIVLVQGFAIHRLTTRFHERYLIVVSVIAMAFSLLGWAYTPNVPVLLVVLMPIALAAGVLNTTLNSALSKAVYPEEVGGTLGLSASLESLTRVISPLAGGLLLQRLGTSAPGLFGALILIGLAPFVWRWLIAKPAPPLPERSLEPRPATPVEVKS